MPELPEVQTVVRELSETIIGKEIFEIEELRENTISNDDGITDFGTIQSIERRGKFILINTSETLSIVVHLRMTGKLIFPYHFESGTHLRAIFKFSDNTEMGFEDIRTFGTIEIIQNKDLEIKFSNLGVEPLKRNFSVDYLKTAFKNRKTSIKACLLNQAIVAGLGNIYVCEILYMANIDPKRLANEISKEELEKIVKFTKKILKKAIEKNGTTISDYRRVDDKTGEFQNFLKIYQKDECPKGHKVTRIKQNGRSTFYCESCQK